MTTDQSSTADLLETLVARFPGLETSAYRGQTRVVVGEPASFEVISCVDYLEYRGATRRYGLVYLLASTATPRRLTVRVFVDDPEPAVRSVVGVWRSADWLEREVWDMFGIRFVGHPDLRRLMMPEQFTAHPLRKDYPLQGRGERHNFPVLTREDG